MIGTTSDESLEHVRLACEAAGWELDQGMVLPLGSLERSLDTVATIPDLNCVVSIGRKSAPDTALEEALLRTRNHVAVTGVVQIELEWVLVSRGGSSGSVVVLDEAAFKDCPTWLEQIDASPLVVTPSMDLMERARLATGDGSLLIEKSRVPKGWQLVESDLGRRMAWYGLCGSRTESPFTTTSTVWLAFQPDREFRGSLSQSLQNFSEHDIDLQYLRSRDAAQGGHLFFCAFESPSSAALGLLVADLQKSGARTRILALIPERIDDELAGDALAARW